MPWMDMSSVLANAYFTDTVTVIRRMQVMNSKGEASPLIMGTYDDIVSVVVPTGSNSLARNEAYENQSKAIQVITEFRLRGASKDAAHLNWLPDLVQWDGNTYIVKDLNDFSAFGAGFMAADCVLFNYNPKPAPEQIAAPLLMLDIPAQAGVRMMMGWL